MVTDFLINLAATISSFVTGLFPQWTVPQWMLDNRQQMIDLLQMGQGLGVWFNWAVLGTCLAAVGTAYVVGLLIRLIRAAVAHIPQFGGGGA